MTDLEDLKCCGNCKNYEPEFSAGEEPYCRLLIGCNANWVCDKWLPDGYTKEERKI